MTDPTVGTYSFLPWVRQGAATALDPGVPARARASLSASIRYNQSQPIDVSLQLLGPGDVVGLDPRQMVRTDPPNMARDVEPNFFVCVEFDRPELPWLFTPVAPSGANQLQPWVCLVVVQQQQGVRVVASASSPAAVLTIDRPATPSAELPDLAEAWAWAHAQVVGSVAGDAGLDDVLAHNPERTISRLMAPRRLEQRTTYFACVVPTFAVGVKAGLGQEITAADARRLDPAWSVSPALSRVDLPVYYHWEFTTGDSGDFEALVRRLVPRAMPSEVGIRDMDISTPEFGMPTVPGAVLGLEGALRSPATQSTVWPAGKRRDFVAALRARLKAGRQPDHSPIVTIPLYGRWHAATPDTPTDGNPPHWLRELNLDPRTRAAAGLGTRVVQALQEDLMASAWEQVGEVDRANRLLRAAQLARAAGLAMLTGKVERFDAGRLLQIAAPTLGRISVPDARAPVTVLAHVRASALPDAAVQAAFRKVTRPLGRVARGSPRVGSGEATLVHRLAEGRLGAPASRTPSGLVTVDVVSARVFATDVRFSHATPEAVAAVDPRTLRSRPRVVGPAVRRNPFGRGGARAATTFKSAAVAHQAVIDVAMRDAVRPEPPPALRLDQIRSTVLAALDPNVAVPAAVFARVRLRGGDSRAGDPIALIMASPEFPAPMYEPLRDISQDVLLPGLGHIPGDTITLLETNPPFIESYMVGLNHEMASELLWREYPTDQRGSYFRQFWDVRGRVPPPSTAAEHEAAKDLVAIHTWSGSALGTNLRGEVAGGRLVLLLRGALLRRYPTAVIYASEARWEGSRRLPSTNESYPLFRGTLEPDITFLGFELTEEAARGSTEHGAGHHPGWFFVIQQRPGEPRFGLDDPSQAAPDRIAAWSELNWSHVTADAYVHVAGPKPDTRGVTAPPGVSWGSTSADQAYITMQQPVRIAVHADAMLPAPGGGR